MAESRNDPPASMWRRVGGWVQTPFGASLVAGFLLLLLGFYVFKGEESTAPVDSGSVAAGQKQKQLRPDDATEQAVERPFWLLPPQTFSDASQYSELVARDSVGTDVLVGLPKEIYEEPSRFEGVPFFIVGRVVRQEEVPGPFYNREFKLVAGERGFSAYVGATSDFSFASTGSVVYAHGRLAAVGESQLPGEAAPNRSIYLLSTRRNGGELATPRFSAPSNGTLGRAFRRVERATG